MNMSPYLIHFFGANVDCSPKTFLGIPAWYQYLYKAQQLRADASGCSVVHLSSTGALGTDIGLVALGVLDIVLRLAGFAAVIYIIYGGIQYITSQGEADKTKHALRTIINAFVGLVISIVAASVVAFVGNRLGG